MKNKDYEYYEKLIENQKIEPNFSEIKDQAKSIIEADKRMQLKTIQLLKIILKYMISGAVLMLLMLILSIYINNNKGGADSLEFHGKSFITLFLILSIIFTNISIGIGFVIILKKRKIK